MITLPPKKGYNARYQRLKNQIHSLHHYPFRLMGVNVAVAVDNIGRTYFGFAHRNPKDPFDRGLGHEISVGRALQQFEEGHNYAPLVVDIMAPMKAQSAQIREHVVKIL